MTRKLNIHMVGLKGVPATYGGVERSVEEVGARLADRGHRVVVHCRTHYTPADLTVHRGMILAREWSLRWKRTDTASHALFGLMAALRDRSDVIALHNYPNGILASLARPFGVPVVLHLHGFEWGLDKWNAADKMILRAMLRPAMAAPTALTSVSRTQAEYVQAVTGRAVRHIPNGVAPPIWLDASAGHPVGLPEEGVPASGYILCVSRLVPQKGVEHLIRAFVQCDLALPLLIVGDHNHAPEYAADLRALAASDPRIRFLGYRFGDELWRLYAGCRLLVLPSEMEGMPLVLLEAMGAGCAILASRLPEIEDVAKGTIAYFESRQVDDLRVQMERLAGDATLLSSLGEAARRWARYHYDWESVTDSYEEVYLEACRPGTRSRAESVAAG